MSRWKKGKSGNPLGRPRGKENHSTIVRKLLQTYSEDIIKKVVELALAGDCAAIKLCLERLCPPLKTHDERNEIRLNQDDSLSLQGQKIIQAAINGEISPSDASAIMNGLAKLASLIEFNEMDKKLTAIEELVNSGKFNVTTSREAEEPEYYPD